MVSQSQDKDRGPWLLVGLGNPGDGYAGNRHNIGFMLIDAIADECSFPPFKKKFQSEYAEGRVKNQKVIIQKPTTYMNESGQAVQAASRFFKTSPDRIVIFHDELDLAPGKVRVKQGGGNAGHNGLRSIQAHLGTPDFWRVRLGIGHPGDKARVHSYVLSNFAKSEHDWLDPLLRSCARHAEFIVQGDMADFMSKTARDIQ